MGYAPPHTQKQLRKKQTEQQFDKQDKRPLCCKELYDLFSMPVCFRSSQKHKAKVLRKMFGVAESVVRVMNTFIRQKTDREIKTVTQLQ